MTVLDLAEEEPVFQRFLAVLSCWCVKTMKSAGAQQSHGEGL